MEDRDIHLGVINSKIYFRREQWYFKIWPILGTQSNFLLDTPLRKIKVLKSTKSELFIRSSFWLSVKMKFKGNISGLLKARITPYYFGIIPAGIYFGEISVSDRDYLIAMFISLSSE